MRWELTRSPWSEMRTREMGDTPRDDFAKTLIAPPAFFFILFETYLLLTD